MGKKILGCMLAGIIGLAVILPSQKVNSRPSTIYDYCSAICKSERPHDYDYTHKNGQEMYVCRSCKWITVAYCTKCDKRVTPSTVMGHNH